VSRLLPYFVTIAVRANADNIAFKPGYIDAHVQFISADNLLITGHDAQDTGTRLLDRCLSADASWTASLDGLFR
jgi:hypothetical protein